MQRRINTYVIMDYYYSLISSIDCVCERYLLNDISSTLILILYSSDADASDLRIIEMSISCNPITVTIIYEGEFIFSMSEVFQSNQHKRSASR